jgi:anaerobic ribonucleoside-triphosphate reductase activating protein
MPNTLEIRLLGNDVMVNGFPAAEAKGLWKGWKRRTVNRD